MLCKEQQETEVRVVTYMCLQLMAQVIPRVMVV